MIIPHFIMHMHVTYDWLKPGDGDFCVKQNRLFARWGGGGSEQCSDVLPHRSTFNLISFHLLFHRVRKNNAVTKRNRH